MIADDECPECGTGYFLHTGECSRLPLHQRSPALDRAIQITSEAMMPNELKDVTRIGPAVPLAKQRAAVVREIGFRKSAYPKWVGVGRMKQQSADEQIAAMEAVLVTLTHVTELIEACKALMTCVPEDTEYAEQRFIDARQAIARLETP